MSEERFRRGEFESRNRQLPADLDQHVAFNANARARSDFEATPQGVPVDCYDVRSVFDVRPIGAFDFNIVSFKESSGDTDSGDVVVSTTVPDGFVMVLRNFDAWFAGLQPVTSSKNGVKWSLQIDGGNVPYNADVPMGIAVDRETVFWLANENNRVAIRIASSAFANVNLTAYVRFYGTFIPKSSRALPFEIANPTNAPNCGVPPPRAPSVPRASETPTPVRIPAAPVQSAPQAPARTTAVVKPSFPINWRAAGAGNTAQLIPVQNDLGQRRDLNRGELQRYLPFLQAQPMNAREKTLFANYLRAVGVL